MNKIEIVLQEEQVNQEIGKMIGFISEDIEKYEFAGSKLILYLSEKANKQEIESQLQYFLKQYAPVQKKEQIIYSNFLKKKYFARSKLSTVHNYEGGFVALDGKALFLYTYFEKRFRDFIIHKSNCVEKVYPVLLPIKNYKKTGYLKKSPQYAMFCCSACEDLKQLQKLHAYSDKGNVKAFLSNPVYALSPSACFHTYMEYENKIIDAPMIVTFTQNVFRNEGRFNYGEFGRLRDYHVREMVFIGDVEYVAGMRETVIKCTVDLVDEFQLNGVVSTASDPFVIPQMQKFKKIQLLENSKYELRLNFKEKEQMSVASFNLHGTAFTNPFNIQVKNCDMAVTGCVGFGLERWVLAFLCQHGEDENNWPKKIKEAYLNEKH